MIEEFNKENNEGNKEKKPKPNIRLEFESEPKPIERTEKPHKTENQEKPAQKS